MGLVVLLRLLLIFVWCVGWDNIGIEEWTAGLFPVFQDEVSSDPLGWEMLVVLLWTLSVLHRLGVVLYGLQSNPWRLYLEVGHP